MLRLCHLSYFGRNQMLSASPILLCLGSSYAPHNLETKEGRLHKHLLKWNGVGSPYAAIF